MEDWHEAPFRCGAKVQTLLEVKRTSRDAGAVSIRRDWTQLGHERSIFTAMHATEARVRATNVELVGCMPSIAARARRNVVEPRSLHRFVSPEIYRHFH
jgi:hypothetical protein